MGKGRVVVTGAAGALGGAVAERLHLAGWEVVALDVAPAAHLPGCAKVAVGGVDLTDEAAVADAFAALGPLAGLVNVAGGFAWETVADGGGETWDRLFAINVKTALNACKAALPCLSVGGAIVNIGAAAADKAEIGMAAYAASKSGVARLTESLAAELRPRGIRVNAVLPSIIDTPANRADMPDADFARWVTADELANVIAFLLSAEAGGVTGAAIPVTGRV
jgi:NAD(P)-dependent dehydrogenase (short-subunit alcohol dehydrogenase family)